MKFTWRLQRLLDLKAREEDVKRDELVALTERAAAIRSRILIERAGFRRMLSELRNTPDGDRLTEQETVLNYAHVFDAKIVRLEANLSELETLQRAKITEVLEIRKFRKGLEKLREKALAEFVRYEQKQEQKETDEYAALSFSRDMIKQS